MTVEHELQRVGKIIAADQGLKVHVRGAAAFAVPGEITIPSLDSYDRLGRHALRMVHGLCDHETGHAKYTDFDVMGACRERDRDFQSKVFRKYEFTYEEQEEFRKYKKCKVLPLLLNAIEDGWIEQAQTRAWVGCGQNLNQKNRWWWEQDVREAGSSVRSRLTTEEPFEAYMLALTMVSRKSVTMGEIRDANEAVHQALEATWHLVEKIDDLDNSGDALRVALQILACFDVENEPPPSGGGVGDEGEEEDKPEEGDEDSPGEPGEDDTEDTPPGTSEEAGEGEEDDTEAPGGGGEPGDDPGDSEEGEEGEGGGEGEEEDDGEDARDEGEDEGGEGGDPPPVNGDFKIDVNDWKPGGRPLTPEDSIGKIMQGLLETGDDDTRPYIVFSHEWDQELDFSSDDNSEHSATLEAVEESARQSVGTLASVFESALQARREKRPIPGTDEGIADPNLLAGFSMGSVPVDEMYYQYVSEDDTDVAVAILCDCSGSTGSADRKGTTASVIREAAVAMSQAMSAAQLAHEVTGFTCVDSHRTNMHDWFNTPERMHKASSDFHEMRKALTDQKSRGVDVFKFARSLYRHSLGRDSMDTHLLLAPVHAIFKGFAQTDLRGLMRITGIHENLDAEALLWQAQRLALRPEKRRVMFVLSDGLPLGSRSASQGQRYLREVINRITEAGIEVYGIGIKASYVKHYYPKWWVVNNLDELCEVAMTGLMDVLLTARQEHQWVDLSA